MLLHGVVTMLIDSSPDVPLAQRHGQAPAWRALPAFVQEPSLRDLIQELSEPLTRGVRFQFGVARESKPSSLNGDFYPAKIVLERQAIVRSKQRFHSKTSLASC